MVRQWVLAYFCQSDIYKNSTNIDEIVCLLFFDDLNARNIIFAPLSTEISGLLGNHNCIDNGNYKLDYIYFMKKLNKFYNEDVPLYKIYIEQKAKLLKNFEDDLRLNEFKPKVLTSFVRNRLIDKVYLPLIGNNLAKQIGEAGSKKRTDNSGMLLLISPPGYGKTTLMEYIANRLGIIFIKINGPAIGNEITSLDPLQAKNSGAREELNKLNLAFEMGDNIMIYVDDIQHCNPEFLQKFISLADAQRKIEGTYKGKSKTYDFRGKKVCIVMAGNPYTESGEKFNIPDMLANRADIYNLGDIIGETHDIFLLSYLENCFTSNSVLNRLVSKSLKDLYTLINIAETGNKDGLEFEADHSPEEINEYVNVIKKLIEVRKVIFQVNKEYIHSASQQEEYRNEPPFKLQGSYRDMNKITGKIVSIMNEKELQTVILSHYENESQALATGAEANLLKFKKMRNLLTDKEIQRWDEIKNSFQKSQKLKGFGNNSQMAQMLNQLELLSDRLLGIKEAITKK